MKLLVKGFIGSLLWLGAWGFPSLAMDEVPNENSKPSTPSTSRVRSSSHKRPNDTLGGDIINPLIVPISPVKGEAAQIQQAIRGGAAKALEVLGVYDNQGYGNAKQQLEGLSPESGNSNCVQTLIDKCE